MSSKGSECLDGLVTGCGRVDGSNHTILAMLALRTVEPDGLRVGNANSVSQDLVCCCERSVGRHETREEGVGFVRHDVLNGYARVVECGLGDGMVLWVELELNHVAWLSRDIVWVKGQRTIGSADLDNVHFEHSSLSGGKTEDGRNDSCC